MCFSVERCTLLLKMKQEKSWSTLSIGSAHFVCWDFHYFWLSLSKLSLKFDFGSFACITFKKETTRRPHQYSVYSKLILNTQTIRSTIKKSRRTGLISFCAISSMQLYVFCFEVFSLYYFDIIKHMTFVVLKLLPAICADFKWQFSHELWTKCTYFWMWVDVRKNTEYGLWSVT